MNNYNNEKIKASVNDASTAIDLTESCYSSASSAVVSETQQKDTLHRGLKARHIQMIALGGTIGKALLYRHIMTVLLNYFF
jgi:amino acid permease